MTENGASLVVLALSVVALVLTSCSLWQLAADVLWVLSATQAYRWWRFEGRRR